MTDHGFLAWRGRKYVLVRIEFKLEMLTLRFVASYSSDEMIAPHRPTETFTFWATNFATALVYLRRIGQRFTSAVGMGAVERRSERYEILRARQWKYVSVALFLLCVYWRTFVEQSSDPSPLSYHVPYVARARSSTSLLSLELLRTRNASD